MKADRAHLQTLAAPAESGRTPSKVEVISGRCGYGAGNQSARCNSGLALGTRTDGCGDSSAACGSAEAIGGAVVVAVVYDGSSGGRGEVGEQRDREGGSGEGVDAEWCAFLVYGILESRGVVLGGITLTGENKSLNRLIKRVL